MNKVFIIGRLTADPTQGSFDGATCANFSVAADTRSKTKDGKAITNFYRCSAWRGLGDNCLKYLHKGDRVSVVGDLVHKSYIDTKGQERYQLDVTVNDVEFMGGGRNPNAQTTPQQQSAPAAQAQSTDELPF